MADDPLSEEEKALFREHMRSVTPLTQKSQKITRVSNPSTKPISKKTQEKSIMKQNHFLSDFISTTVYSESILHYAHPSMTSKRTRDLKKGAIPWESRLDLHGLKTDAARQALCQFISNQCQKQNRCVLIIHGKGGHEGAPPVIKNLVNRWLPQMDEVLAFHSALPKDGGQGAVYVLLKKSGLALYTDYEG